MNLRDIKTIAQTTGIMAFRILPSRFDVAKLCAAYETHVKPLEKIIHGNPTYGGWSLTSQTGDISESFWRGGKQFDKETNDFTKRANNDPKFGINMIVPTPIHQYFVEDYFDVMADMGFRDIHRVRITEIDGAGGGVRWHVDRPEAENGHWRFHLVLQTEKGATFQWRWRPELPRQKTNLPADGHLYLVRTDVCHRVRCSTGVTKPRAHIMADIRSRDLCQVDCEIEPVLDLGPNLLKTSCQSPEASVMSHPEPVSETGSAD